MNTVLMLSGNLLPMFTCGLLITLFVLVLCRSFGFKFGLVDRPGGRKKHKNAVPLVGGISIFLGASVLLLPLIPYSNACFLFWLCCFVLVFLSVIDDRYGLRPGPRLITQFVLVCMIILFGETNIINLGNLFGWGDVFLGPAGLLFTALSMVGIINAVNMMDGVDGLTGCVCLVEFGCLLFLSLKCGASTETLIITIIMGALLAFLAFNFPTKFSEKRKVFLGDAGSMLMGLTLAWVCVRISQGNHASDCPPVLMLWIMALPLMDTLHLMINRKIRGVSPFKADRRHIHHILLQLNYSSRQVVLILTSMALLIGTVGILLWMSGVPEWLLFMGIIILFCIYSLLAYRFKKRVSRRKYKFTIIPFTHSGMGAGK